MNINLFMNLCWNTLWFFLLSLTWMMLRMAARTAPLPGGGKVTRLRFVLLIFTFRASVHSAR